MLRGWGDERRLARGVVGEEGATEGPQEGWDMGRREHGLSIVVKESTEAVSISKS